jgi:hypothetical protein
MAAFVDARSNEASNSTRFALPDLRRTECTWYRVVWMEMFSLWQISLFAQP